MPLPVYFIYLQSAVSLKEIERFYNPAGVVLFWGVVKEIEYAGYPIPPGWVVIIAQGLTHRMSEIYTNAESFDPERFAPPREEVNNSKFKIQNSKFQIFSDSYLNPD